MMITKIITHNKYPTIPDHNIYIAHEVPVYFEKVRKRRWKKKQSHWYVIINIIILTFVSLSERNSIWALSMKNAWNGRTFFLFFVAFISANRILCTIVDIPFSIFPFRNWFIILHCFFFSFLKAIELSNIIAQSVESLLPFESQFENIYHFEETSKKNIYQPVVTLYSDRAAILLDLYVIERPRVWQKPKVSNFFFQVFSFFFFSCDVTDNKVIRIIADFCFLFSLNSHAHSYFMTDFV